VEPAGPFTISGADLAATSVDVGGILLPQATAAASETASAVVDTPSTRSNLRALAIALRLQTPVLLEGPAGAGKTTLVEHLAQRSGRTLQTIQVGDHTDSKTLLGAYVCTTTPGQFRYQVGPLVHAVSSGDWVLIEDVDLAPMEVVSVLLPLLESRQLFIPGRGERIQAASTFQLFATRRKGSGSVHSYSAQLDNLWTRVFVEPATSSELQTIVSGLYPVLSAWAPTLIQAFDSVSAFMRTQSVVQANAREITARDLLRWISRVVKLGTHGNRDAIFLEALECFSSMLGSPAARATVTKLVCDVFDVAASRLEQIQAAQAPQVSLARGLLSIGRVTHSSALAQLPVTTYAYTSTSSRLLEQLAVAVRMQEPVLLVGETGTGKTSAVQHLAALNGRTVTVINMSQQSDSTELLGGFKPVTMRLLLEPILRDFEELFYRTFKRSENADFVPRLQKLFAKQKWTRLVEALVKGTETAAAPRKDGKHMAPNLRARWTELRDQVTGIGNQLARGENSFAFAFIEGTLTKAVKAGDWLLLDEINLAPAETLECLSGLLDRAANSFPLYEKGELTMVPRHPQFRIFACMNPPTDATKRHLSAGLRNRFTEIYVPEPTVCVCVCVCVCVGWCVCVCVWVGGWVGWCVGVCGCGHDLDCILLSQPEP
jgi:midasin